MVSEQLILSVESCRAYGRNAPPTFLGCLPPQDPSMGDSHNFVCIDTLPFLPYGNRLFTYQDEVYSIRCHSCKSLFSVGVFSGCGTELKIVEDTLAVAVLRTQTLARQAWSLQQSVPFISPLLFSFLDLLALLLHYCV